PQIILTFFFSFSESSLFVWDHKLILKTCGTTTLLYAVPKLLALAKEYGLGDLQNLFYSRKNYLFPDRQREMHVHFDSEVAFLDSIFPDGAAFTLGQVNGEHWHLYVIE